MKYISALISLMIILISVEVIHAQQSVWAGSKEQLMSVKEKGKQKVSTVKKWQDHIRQWGLDSNYNHALSLGARLHSNGWSGGIYYLTQKSAGRKKLWELYFSGIRQEKEIQQQRTGGTYNYLGKSIPYIFGKVNNAYTLQLGYGRQRLLLPAVLDGNLSVSIRYSAGPALALLKPYYLKLIYVDYVPEAVAHIQEEKYSAHNTDHFLEPGFILGKDKWSKGLGEMRYIPGLFAELAFVIEPDKNKSFIQTITFGGNAAFYSSEIEIMANRKAYPYQASFFVGLALGKRWK